MNLKLRNNTNSAKKGALGAKRILALLLPLMLLIGMLPMDVFGAWSSTDSSGNPVLSSSGAWTYTGNAPVYNESIGGWTYDGVFSTGTIESTYDWRYKHSAKTSALTLKNETGGNITVKYTVENCTFTGAGQAKVAIKSYTGGDWNLKVIGCTVENMERANYRLPIFLSLPIKTKIIICEPILERIDLSPYLSDEIAEVVVGGESGENARICDWAWVTALKDQCTEKNVKFTFKQTGAKFKKDGKVYRIKRKYQHSQAEKADINT